MTKILGDKKIVKINNEISIGENPVIIAGPCSVESEESLNKTVSMLKEVGVDILRGGAFKPRTSPYTFQGLGEEGLKILYKVGKSFNLPIISELMDEKYLGIFLKYVDIIQIGSRNMYNYPLLKTVGQTDKPILLKRGMSATIYEWSMAAEYIASYGNSNIILCERGIRSYDNYTRNTLDLAAVPIMKKETGLPIIVDPSHGTGRRELIEPMSKAALACGADGIMVEVHHNPDEALSDSEQTIGIDMYKKLFANIGR